MRILVTIFSLLGIIAGCAPTPSDSSGDTSTSINPQFENNISTLYGAGSTVTGSMESDIVWKDSLGVLQSLDSLRGKIVLLNFWATWCEPCDSEMTALNSISDSLKQNVVVIAVSVDVGSSIFDRVKLFAQTRNMKFQVVIDPPAKTYFNYGGDTYIPISFAIDRNGHIAHKFVGAQRKDQFMYILNQIL